MKQQIAVEMKQEILDRYLFKTFNGQFGVNDPVTHDEIIGYYQTRQEAENAFNNYVLEKGITFN